MITRVFLFLLTNFAVIVVLTAVTMILENVFGINITGYLGGNYTGLLIFAAIFGFGGSFISLFLSKWSAKRAYKINIISINQYDNINSKQKIVFDIVRDLSERNNIKMPEVGFYISQEPNAFATGASKNSSLVAVSSGLLDVMDKSAIEGVIGHEMAHILNGDMVTMTLLQGILNTFVIFISRILAGIADSYLNGDRQSNSNHSWTYFIFTMIFEIVFGILASIIAMWFSRHREFRADAGSAKYVGKEKMIAGLEALKRMQSIASGEDSKLATMKISTKGRSGLMYLFSSHPDLDDRINALEKLRI